MLQSTRSSYAVILALIAVSSNFVLGHTTPTRISVENRTVPNPFVTDLRVPVAQSGATDVLTQHFNNQRTGAVLTEHVLNVGNVNVKTFGKLFTREVDGQLYAQPLIVTGLKMPDGRVHDVVFLATEHNSVYAYDADDPKASAPLWHVNLGPSAPWSDFYQPPITDLNEEVGITSTPVIDRATNTIYVEAKTKVGLNYFQFLHALDIRTGAEKPNSPVGIHAWVKGTGDDTIYGLVPFNPRTSLQRPGLALLNGIVYLGFGSHGDHFEYHGWLLGYDMRTLKQRYVFCTTPNGTAGSIWQSGQGIACDRAGNMYVSTGNGSIDVKSGGTSYSQCILKLRSASSANPVLDWFMPYNADQMNASDADLGSCGPLLIPGRSLIVGGSKTGWLYVVKTSAMGQFNATSNRQIVQSFQASNGHIHGSPIFYDHPQVGPTVYFWGENDKCKAFHLDGDHLDTTPQSESTMPVPTGMPGGILSLSADGKKPGTAILWATRALDQNANWNTVPGEVQAFDASDLSHELWNSTLNEARDSVGNFAKFNPPTIANGKVYVASFSRQLVVYGLLP